MFRTRTASISMATYSGTIFQETAGFPSSLDSLVDFHHYCVGFDHIETWVYRL
jgi:hypothetical protein